MSIVPSLRWYGNGRKRDTTTSLDDGLRRSISRSTKGAIGSSPERSLDETVPLKPFGSSGPHKPLSNGTRRSRQQPIPMTPHGKCMREKRLGVKMESTLKGKRLLLTLWKQQKGLCPRCHQKITKLTGWHNHHKVWRSRGGGNQLENRVLLHPTCHQQLHSQGDSEVEPCPERGI